MCNIFRGEELNVRKVYSDQKRSIDLSIRKIFNQISAREKRISEKVHPNSGIFKESRTRFYRRKNEMREK